MMNMDDLEYQIAFSMNICSSALFSDIVAHNFKTSNNPTSPNGKVLS